VHVGGAALVRVGAGTLSVVAGAAQGSERPAEFLAQRRDAVGSDQDPAAPSAVRRPAGRGRGSMTRRSPGPEHGPGVRGRQAGPGEPGGEPFLMDAGWGERWLLTLPQAYPQQRLVEVKVANAGAGLVVLAQAVEQRGRVERPVVGGRGG
jgi:hypothetical protein